MRVQASGADDENGENGDDDDGLAQYCHSIRGFSIFPVPRGDHLMMVLRPYFDDSATEHICTMAGYVGEIDSWDIFEKQWPQMLQPFGAPYLHMKQLAHWQPPYDSWKKTPTKRDNFLKASIEVISQCGLFAIASPVLREHLKRFNAEAGTTIEEIPFALSCCLMAIEDNPAWKGRTVECVIDKFGKPSLAIAKAFQYLANDPDYKNCEQHICVTAIPKCESSQTIKPIQAADLLAYECSSSNEPMAEWAESNPGESLKHYWEWLHHRQPKRQHWTRERMSVIGLQEATGAQGFLWDYGRISQLHDIRCGCW